MFLLIIVRFHGIARKFWFSSGTIKTATSRTVTEFQAVRFYLYTLKFLLGFN